MNNEKITKLVIIAQKGDKAALNDLFTATYNDIYFFVYQIVKDEELACDITQETYIAIIKNIKSLKDPGVFKAWAKKVAYSQCTRYFSKKKDILAVEDEEGNTVFDTLPEEKGEFIPDEALEQEEFKKAVHDILNSLSEEQRSAIMLYYFDEMSVKDIADIQGVSEGTVKSRLNYGRKTIKNGVEEYEKKHNVKLHVIPFFPFFKWIFDDSSKKVMPIPAETAVANAVESATNTTLTIAQGTVASDTIAAKVGTAGIFAKITAFPLYIKIIAGIVAVSVVIGGSAATILHFANDNEKSSKVESGSASFDDKNSFVSEDIDHSADVEISDAASDLPDTSEEEATPKYDGYFWLGEYSSRFLRIGDDCLFYHVRTENERDINNLYVVNGNGDVYASKDWKELYNYGKLPSTAKEYEFVTMYRGVSDKGKYYYASSLTANYAIMANMGNGEYHFVTVESVNRGNPNETIGKTTVISGVEGDLMWVNWSAETCKIDCYAYEKDGSIYLKAAEADGTFAPGAGMLVTYVLEDGTKYSKFKKIHQWNTHHDTQRSAFRSVFETYDGKVISCSTRILSYIESAFDSNGTNGIELNVKSDRVFDGYNVLTGVKGNSVLYKSLTDNVFYGGFSELPYNENQDFISIALPENYTVGDIKTVYDDHAAVWIFQFNDGKFFKCNRNRYSADCVYTYMDVLTAASRQGKVKRVVGSAYDDWYLCNVIMDDGFMYRCYNNSETYEEYSGKPYENPFV
ncbi:MAG: sigma-70 family RNA polymerase sigma factor [Clostridia bacterium]|nr:sigma-70 family RNA polymerase sigma factor [Clostridia bacterium]